MMMWWVMAVAVVVVVVGHRSIINSSVNGMKFEDESLRVMPSCLSSSQKQRK